MTRGLIVAFLLVFGTAPALAQAAAGDVVRYAQHASESSDSESGGHALDSGPIASEDEIGESVSEGGQCAQGGSA